MVVEHRGGDVEVVESGTGLGERADRVVGLADFRPEGVAGAFDVPADAPAFDDAGVQPGLSPIAWCS